MLSSQTKKRSVVLHKDASPNKLREEEGSVENNGLINADIVKDLRNER